MRMAMIATTWVYTEKYLYRLFSPENLPNIVLALVGIGGMIVAVSTLRAIKRQTQALVDAERARVFVTASKTSSAPGEATFTIRATNYGKLPARLTMYTYAEVVLKDPEKELVNSPQYGDSLLHSEKTIASGHAFDIAVFDPFSAASKERIYAAPGSRAVILGKLEYLDGLSEKAREVRFAYKHVRTKMSELGGNVTRIVAPEYNRYT